MENVTLIERFEASRVEISRLANQKSIREENAERQKLELELKLEEYQKVAEQVDQVFSRLAVQDKEWQGAYAKSVMVVPHGPKKLLAITDVLRRLEQKVSEVNILRMEIKELKQAAEKAREERRVMVDALSGGPNPTKYLTQMVLERHEALEEDRRIQERMQTDYHENQKLKAQVEGLLVKRKNIEHIQKILADILSNRGGYKDTALLERLKAAWI